ncbi:uncharacterized protein ABDE67_010757 [Symphorus nematophorus]
MKTFCLLLSISLSCCCNAAGDHHDDPPAAMTMGAAQSQLVQDQDQQQDSPWKQEVLDLLKELVLVQKEIAKGQGQVVQLLGMLETQGSQQIQDLQNVARHQSLLVENHQALLLQTSRIATQLQDAAKKPAAAAAPSQ